MLGEDDTTLTMYFTASGRRGQPRTFEQRLFETVGRFLPDEARTEGWSEPVESVAADGHHYIVANQAEPENGGIKGFRDPGYFRDPADGANICCSSARPAGSPKISTASSAWPSAKAMAGPSSRR